MKDLMPNNPYTGRPHGFKPYIGGANNTLRTNHRHANCTCGHDLAGMIATAIRDNERGDDDDRRQIVADLISNDDSPFLPDDEESLRTMTEGTLHKMRDRYTGKKAKKQQARNNQEAGWSFAGTTWPDVQANAADDPALAAMTPLSSLQAYRSNQGEPVGVDDVVQRAQHRAEYGFFGADLFSGRHRLRTAVPVPVTQAEVDAMHPPSSWRAFQEMQDPDYREKRAAGWRKSDERRLKAQRRAGTDDPAILSMIPESPLSAYRRMRGEE